MLKVKLTEVSKEYVLNLKAGHDLDYLVHQAMDEGRETHWLHIWDYSTDPDEFISLIKKLQYRCEFYSFNMASDCINVVYDFEREVFQAEDMLEGLCKAVVLNWIGNNKEL